jgi:flagellar FliL protein
MATATTATAKPEEPAAAGKSRKKLLIVLILGVLAAVAAWFLLMGPGAGAEEKDAAAKKPELGEVLQLEPITMNLADGRLLKVGLALQLVLEPKEAEVTGSVALDEAIAFLGERSYAQLADVKARATTKQEFSERVSKRYHGDVVEVYFTEFVMQ